MDNKIGFKKINHNHVKNVEVIDIKKCHSHEHDECCSCNHNHDKKTNIVLVIRLALSIVLLIVSFFLKDIFQYIVLSISYLIIAYDILLNAFKNIIKGKVFDENFLMSLASLTALIVYIFNPYAGIDAFDGVLVIVLYQIGEFFQHYASDKTRKSISSMFDLNVDKVQRVNSHIPEIIDVYDIKVGDIILIKPGEIVPIDGEVIEGSSSLNTSSLTGESKPLEVFNGSRVLANFINNDGAIKIKATSTYKESTASKVKEMILEASNNKSSGERFISKFAKIYTPIVILISLFIMFGVPLILGFEKYFMDYLYKGLSIMVISCPCALVISVPLSYFVGIGKSAKSGILIKGGSYIEKLDAITAIAFDKTGTLTKGEFYIEEINSNNEELIKNLLFTLEKNVTHPIGKSIVEHLKNSAVELEITDFKNIPGYGLSARYEGNEVLVGNASLLNKSDIEFKKVNKAGTILYVSYDDKYLGYVLIKDALKDDAKKVINVLKNKYELYLISGDNKLVVEDTAKMINISNYYYEKLPLEKNEIINEIKKHKKLAYAGDGINDAVSLINSDVGIAFKSIGSDIVMNSSDVVLLDSSLNSLNKAINIAKKTMSVVKINIILSILIKFLIMICAIIFTLPMYVAIIGDVGVCLLAILNTLTIYFKKY